MTIISRILVYNILNLYTESIWGLDMRVKEKEFTHSDARLLVLFQDDEQSPQHKLSSNGSLQSNQR